MNVRDANVIMKSTAAMLNSGAEGVEEGNTEVIGIVDAQSSSKQAGTSQKFLAVSVMDYGSYCFRQ